MTTNISEVNKALTNIKPPTVESWLDWKWDVKAAINNSNVWRDIMTPAADGTYPTVPVPNNPARPTPAEQTAIRAFNEKSHHACQWIQRAAGRHNEDITEPHVATSSPVAMWEALEAQFAPKGMSEQISLFGLLCKTLKEQDEKWPSYFDRQDDLTTSASIALKGN